MVFALNKHKTANEQAGRSLDRRNVARPLHVERASRLFDLYFFRKVDLVLVILIQKVF